MLGIAGECYLCFSYAHWCHKGPGQVDVMIKCSILGSFYSLNFHGPFFKSLFCLLSSLLCFKYLCIDYHSDSSAAALQVHSAVFASSFV